MCMHVVQQSMLPHLYSSHLCQSTCKLDLLQLPASKHISAAFLCFCTTCVCANTHMVVWHHQQVGHAGFVVAVCTRLLWMAGAGAQIALTTNLSRWMLVPSSMVDLDGSSCNMVGTGYTAFANQAVCHSPLLFTVIQLAYTCKVKLPFKQYVTGCRRNSPLNLRCSHACFVNGAFD